MPIFTPNLKISLPVTGDSGIVARFATAMQQLEMCITRTAVVNVSAAVAGVSVLSDVDWQSAVIWIQGAKTANYILEVPLKTRLMLIANDSTGAFTSSVRSGPSATPVLIAQGARKWLLIKDLTGVVELL